MIACACKMDDCGMSRVSIMVTLDCGSSMVKVGLLTINFSQLGRRDGNWLINCWRSLYFLIRYRSGVGIFCKYE